MVKGHIDRIGVVSLSSHNSLPTEGSHTGEGSLYHDSDIMRCKIDGIIQFFTREGQFQVGLPSPQHHSKLDDARLHPTKVHIWGGVVMLGQICNMLKHMAYLSKFESNIDGGKQA